MYVTLYRLLASPKTKGYIFCISHPLANSTAPRLPQIGVLCMCLFVYDSYHRRRRRARASCSTEVYFALLRLGVGFRVTIRRSGVAISTRPVDEERRRGVLGVLWARERVERDLDVGLDVLDEGLYGC